MEDSELYVKNDFKLLFRKCLKNKMLIGIAIIVSLILASVYLIWRKPSYEVHASVTLYEDSSSPSSIMKQFSIDNLFGGSGSVYNEMQMMASHTNMMNVVRNLGINISYYKSDGLLGKTLEYPHPPVSIMLPEELADTLIKPITFKIRTEYGGMASVVAKHGGKKIGEIKGQMPLTLETQMGDFDFYLNDSATITTPITEYIKVNSISAAAEEFLEKVNFSIPIKLAEVIEITYKGKNRELSLDLVKGIISQYNVRGIEDVREKKQAELRFIDSRIASLTNEISGEQGSMQKFKENQGLTDLSAEVKYNLEKKARIEAEIINVKAQYEVLDATIASIGNPADQYSPVPSILDTRQEEVNSIEAYNNLLMQRKQLMQSAKPGNESLRRLDVQIESAQQDILTTLKRIQNSYGIALSELQKNLNVVNATLNSMPQAESGFKDIYRNQAIREQLYIYMIEQREELAMSIQAASQRAKIVNEPYVSALHTQRSALWILIIAALAGFVFFPAIWYIGIINRDNKS